MKARRIVLLAAIAAATALRLAAIDVSSGEIALGEWNKGYSRARALADANHIPMLVMWARKTCPRCVACKTAMEQEDFRVWQAERKLVMVLIHEGEVGNGYALGLIRQGNQMLSDLPLLCVYWLKPDGSTVLRSFVGRTGHATLPVRSGSSVAMQVAGSADSVLAAAGWAGAGVTPIVTPQAPARPSTPQFEKDAYSLALNQYMAINQTIAVTNLAGGTVRVKKTSGKLPNGIKATFDATSGKLSLIGIPTKPGTYTSSWRVSEKRKSGTVSGDNQTITFVVTAIAAINPTIGANGIRTTGFAETGAGEVAGTLTLQVRPNGKVAAKYVGRHGKASFTSRAWDALSANGTLSVTAIGKNDSIMKIQITADGMIGGLLQVKGESERLTPNFQFPAWGAAHLATAYVSSQTAVLLSSSADQSGSLTLKMSSGGARTGKMAYRGKLPNGQSVSGNGILVEISDGNAALLPIVQVVRGTVFSGQLAFDANTGILLGGNILERSATGTSHGIEVLPGGGLK